MVNDPENVPNGEDPAVKSLDERIAAARKAEDQRLAREHAPLSESGTSGVQVISTMVGYPLGGIIIGLLLDNLLDTLPWITIGLMFIAFIGACVHVMRMIKNNEAK